VVTLRSSDVSGPTALVLGAPAILAYPGVGACGLYVDPARPLWVVGFDPTRSLALPIPARHDLLGMRIGAQAIAVPSGSAALALSNGVRLALAW
jgi:hypothetical protein